MKTCIVLVLVAGVFLQSVSCIVIVAGFSLNRVAIAKNLCEQRTVPGNCCQGSCQLRKQLNDEAQKDQTRIPSGLRVRLEIHYVAGKSSPPGPGFPPQRHVPHAAHQFSPFPPANAIFHPPEFVTKT